MVSQAAASYIRDRVHQVTREHYLKIEAAFVVEDIDTIEEIKRGCGRLRSEEEIRQLIKGSNKCNQNTYGAFISAEVVFVLDKELEGHRSSKEEMLKRRSKAKEAVESAAHHILDMLYMKGKIEDDSIETAFRDFETRDFVKEART